MLTKRRSCFASTISRAIMTTIRSLRRNCGWRYRWRASRRWRVLAVLGNTIRLLILGVVSARFSLDMHPFSKLFGRFRSWWRGVRRRSRIWSSGIGRSRSCSRGISATLVHGVSNTPTREAERGQALVFDGADDAINPNSPYQGFGKINFNADASILTAKTVGGGGIDTNWLTNKFGDL